MVVSVFFYQKINKSIYLGFNRSFIKFSNLIKVNQLIKNMLLVTGVVGGLFGCEHEQNKENDIEIPTNISTKTSKLDWENPEIFEINKLPARASFFAYESAQVALGNQPSQSSRFLSLNGKWKFNWVDKPSLRPIDFYKTDYDTSQWHDINVPGNVERQGFGTPHYMNIDYVFPADQPNIPHSYNPVSAYVKYIELPKDWQGQQISIHFGAVNSAMYLWINGEKVGYSQGSKLPAEFNITDHLNAGENKIAVEVYRWSDGSYLEDQDGWSLSGIERDVYLYATPNNHIKDYSISSALVNDFKDGQLNITVDLSLQQDHEIALMAKLFDNKQALYSAKKTYQAITKDTVLEFSTVLNEIAPWSAETPKLYQLELTLFNKAGEVKEVIRQNVGFRTLTMKSGLFLVNGKPVTIRGVNRVEHHAIGGRTLTKASMEKDIKLMKELNINAVRTAHFPNDPYWYDLADEYGLYVMNEANIESHKYMQIGNQPDQRQQIDDKAVSTKSKKKAFNREESQKKYHLGYKAVWQAAHLARVSRMVERDKNHPSVILWSLGNEAGLGDAFDQSAQWIKENDSSRPVTYGGWGTRNGHTIVDYSEIYTPMYDSIEELADYAINNPDRPLIMAEYAHAMGNSVGNLDKYWQVIYQHEQLQGGFIWDWVDQTFLETNNNGDNFWGYGGDYNDGNNNKNFLANGLIQPDRTLNPHAYEVRKIYQPVEFSSLEQNSFKVTLTNRYDFVDLSHVDFSWQLEENGQVISEGKVNTPNLKAGQQEVIELPLNNIEQKAGAEYFVTIKATENRGNNAFLPKGHVIAWQQFPLMNNAEKIKLSNVDRSTTLSGITFTETASSVNISAENLAIAFDKSSGLLRKYQVNNVELIDQGLSGNFWRAVTDNDKGWGVHYKLNVWQEASTKQVLDSITAKQSSQSSIVITTAHILAEDIAKLTTKYVVSADGQIDVTTKLTPLKYNLPNIPRVGMHMQVAKEFQLLEWFGRGPLSSYSDRKTSMAVGIYQSQVAEQLHDYARPQESGNKSDVRWLTLTDAQGNGLKISSATPLNVTAVPLNKFDLYQLKEAPRHSSAVALSDTTTVRIDILQMGVGGDNSWGAMPHDEFLIPAKEYQFTFTLTPLTK